MFFAQDGFDDGDFYYWDCPQWNWETDECWEIEDEEALYECYLNSYPLFLANTYLFDYSLSQLQAFPEYADVTTSETVFCEFLQIVDDIELINIPEGYDYFWIYDSSEVDLYLDETQISQLTSTYGITLEEYGDMILVLAEDYWSTIIDDDSDYDDDYWTYYTYYWECFNDTEDTYCGEAVPWELMNYEDTLTYSFSTIYGIRSFEAYCNLIKCLASYNIDTTSTYTGEVCTWDYYEDTHQFMTLKEFELAMINVIPSTLHSLKQ